MKNYYKIDGVQSKQGGAKNVQCTFCDAAFSRCSSSRALAHILGRAVLGQKRAIVGARVPIRKDDVPIRKEDLTSPAERLATGEIKVVESKMLDATLASFFYENALSFNVSDTKFSSCD